MKTIMGSPQSLATQLFVARALIILVLIGLLVMYRSHVREMADWQRRMNERLEPVTGAEG